MVFIILGLPSRVYNRFTVLLVDMPLSLYFLLASTQLSHWFCSWATCRNQLSIKNGLKRRSLYKLLICLNLRHVSNIVTNIFLKKLYTAACFSFSFFLYFFFNVVLLIVQVLALVYGWERCTTFDYCTSGLLTAGYRIFSIFHF